MIIQFTSRSRELCFPLCHGMTHYVPMHHSGGPKAVITLDGVDGVVPGLLGCPQFGIGAHAPGAMTAANAPDQGYLQGVGVAGHANIATTGIYDHLRTRPGTALPSPLWIGC